MQSKPTAKGYIAVLPAHRFVQGVAPRRRLLAAGIATVVLALG